MPTDTFVVSNQTRLAVRDYGGNGPSIIALHGAGRNLADWNDVGKSVQGRLRLVAFDQRGCAQSEEADDLSVEAHVSDIAAIADQLILGQPSVVGHSAGAWIALHYASRHPDCPAVVGVDSAVLDRNLWDPFAMLDLAESEQGVDYELHLPDWGLTGQPQESLETMVRDLNIAGTHEEEVLRRNYHVAQKGLLSFRPSSANQVRQAREFRKAYPSEEIYGQIRGEVVVVVGIQGRDRAWRDEALKLGARHPSIRIETLDCGHMVPLELPIELADILADLHG